MSSISFVSPPYIQPSSSEERGQKQIEELLKCDKEHDLDLSIQKLLPGTCADLIEELLKCDKEHDLDSSIQILLPGTCADLAEKALQQLDEAAKRSVEETRKNQLSNLADKLIKHLSVGPRKNACQIQLQQLKELFASNADMKQQAESTVSSTSNAYRKACPELAQDEKLNLIEHKMTLLLIKYLNDYSWQRVSITYDIYRLKLNWNDLYEYILNVVKTWVASENMRDSLSDYSEPDGCRVLKLCIDNMIKRALAPIPQYATNDLITLTAVGLAYLDIYAENKPLHNENKPLHSVLAHEISSLIIPPSYFEWMPWQKNCVLIPCKYTLFGPPCKYMPFEPLSDIEEPFLAWLPKDSPDALFYKAVENLQRLVAKRLENPQAEITVSSTSNTYRKACPESVQSSSPAERGQKQIEELLKCDKEHDLDSSIQKMSPGTCADLAEKALQQLAEKALQRLNEAATCADLAKKARQELNEVAKRLVEETLRNQLSKLADELIELTDAVNRLIKCTDKLIKHMSIGPQKKACQIQFQQLKVLFASNADMKQQAEITVNSTSNAYCKACPELAQDGKLSLIERKITLLLIKYLNNYSWQRVPITYDISGLKIIWNYLYEYILNVVETWVASENMRDSLSDYSEPDDCRILKLCIDNIIKRALTPIPQYATNDLITFIGDDQVGLNIYAENKPLHNENKPLHSVLAHEISSLIIPPSYFDYIPWQKNCVLIPCKYTPFGRLHKYMPFEPLSDIKESFLQWFPKDSPDALFYKAVGNLQTLVAKRLENPNVVSPHREGIDKHNSQTETP